MINASAKDLKRFSAWLVAQGAEILPKLGDWELLRFKCGKDIGIAWESTKSGGAVSAANSRATRAWRAWKAGKALPVGSERKTPKRTKISKRSQVIRALKERDGDRCWYCPSEFDDDNQLTVEHLVPKAHGGPDHISNLVLACEPCNCDAGHLSVAEKVILREQRQTVITGDVKINLSHVPFLAFANQGDGGAS